MKNAMQKDFWREIQHTRSRFFSIMILVALSVAFLSGLKATAPDMKRTGDDYLDSLHLADIQVLSTLGLTDDDITAIRAQDKVEDAEGEYVIDAFASSDSTRWSRSSPSRAAASTRCCCAAGACPSARTSAWWRKTCSR